MDALSDVLRAAQLSGGVFLQAEFTAPWCVAVNVTTQFCAPLLGPATHLIAKCSPLISIDSANGEQRSSVANRIEL